MRAREPAGLAALLALTIYCLGVSWRKWPDALVDFGRELYLPWRISNGAMLYRDVDNFFGPLSQYANAALFRLFGPGLMVLVAANLAIFAAILAAVYLLFRQAWGAAAAVVCSAIFVTVFGFSQYVGIGNYNFATPYAHEVTHGFLVCLVLALVLLRWTQEPASPQGGAGDRFSSPALRRQVAGHKQRWPAPRTAIFTAGFLFGLTAVLKPEILLAALLVTLAAAAIRLRHVGSISLRSLALWAAGAILPTLAFAGYFSTRVPFTEALALACRAWINASTTTRLTGESIQLIFLGLDHPWENLVAHLSATLIALLLAAAMGAIAWLADRSPQKWQRFALAGALAGVVLWLACSIIAWPSVGRCLLGLTLAYLVFCCVSLIRKPEGKDLPAVTARVLITVLAAALMARMLLNGRFYQYGFYQSALAALIAPAVLIGEMPGRLRLGQWGRVIAVTATLLLVAPGVVKLSLRSHELLGMKTYSVGSGADRFYTYSPNVEPAGEIVRTIADWLRQKPSGQTLLVLPEGEMINYLVRMPSPVAPVIFYSAATSGGGEEAIVQDLERNPPDWIAIISRDLREFGIERYGEGPGNGGQILTWMRGKYQTALSVGDDPLDPRQRGALILQRSPVPGVAK